MQEKNPNLTVCEFYWGKTQLFLFFLLFIMSKAVYYLAGNVTENMQLHSF